MLETIGQPSRPMLRRLLEYWEEKRRGRTFPARRDIDPAEIVFALGHVMLVDVVDDGRQFRFRLYGTKLVARAGYDPTGKTLEALPAEAQEMFLERFRAVLATRRPLVAQSAKTHDGRQWRCEDVWLPLAADGTTIDMIFGALDLF